MASLKLAIAYRLDDGRTGEVTADQRDFAAWEIHPDYAPIDVRPHSGYRFLAWSAVKRAGVLNKPFEWWQEHCVEAVDPDDSDEVPAGDPTQPGRSAGA